MIADIFDDGVDRCSFEILVTGSKLIKNIGIT